MNMVHKECRHLLSNEGPRAHTTATWIKVAGAHLKRRVAGLKILSLYNKIISRILAIPAKQDSLLVEGHTSLRSRRMPVGLVLPISSSYNANRVRTYPATVAFSTTVIYFHKPIAYIFWSSRSADD